MSDNETLFKVKGKPDIQLRNIYNVDKSKLKTVLEQIVEESRAKNQKEGIFVAILPGAEIRPENIPYIPDSNKTILDLHLTATPERNAGLQDSALVPRMYQKYVRPAKVEVTLESFSVPINEAPAIEIIEQIKSIEGEGPAIPEKKAEDAQFKIGITREQMHHGGHCFVDESKPYRPGDVK